MNPFAQMEVVRAIYDERRRTAEQSRRTASVRHRLDPTTAQLVIRRACGRRDARKLERLAALDSSPTPAGPTLVAEMDGQLVAALPLSGENAVADPFVPSAPVVEMLRLRAAQLRLAA
jgi:hypothetical protein